MSIRVRSESPSQSKVWRDERPGAQLPLPLQPALAPRGRDRGRLDPPGSVRCRERRDSTVGYLGRLQDRESVGSAKVVMCAVFARPPPSGFLLRRPRRNSEDVVIPLTLPCLPGMGSSLTKYASVALPITCRVI